MKKKTTLILTGAAVCGVVCAIAIAGKGPGSSARKVVCYQDSMHPWVKSSTPGKCTICAMDLTPIFEGEKGGGDDDIVVLGSNSITVLNVQTDEARRQPLEFDLRVAGVLEADDTRKSLFSAPAAGRIEQVSVESVGVEVVENQPLFTFYSPELTTWRRTYVVRGRPGNDALPQFVGRTHKPGSGVSPVDPEEEMRMTLMPNMRMPGPGEDDPYFSDLLSPQAGTVVERKVFNGQYVREGDRLLTIVDTSVLWFRFDVYEKQLGWIRPGQSVRLSVPALPGREFSAVIAVIEPSLNESTRTIKVRANVENPKESLAGYTHHPLQLGMYAEGRVEANTAEVLSVPRSAVIFPGGQAYVHVEAGKGAYEIRPVRLGRQGDNKWEILGGLEEGDPVVTSGNVLLDAQAQIDRKSALTANFSGPMLAESTSQTPLPARGAVKPEPSQAMNGSTMSGGEPAGPAQGMNMGGMDEEPLKSSGKPGEKRTAALAKSDHLRITNTRTPEGEERLVRSFGYGLAERHRMAREQSPAGSQIKPTQASVPPSATPPTTSSNTSGARSPASTVSRNTPPPTPLSADQRVACGKFLEVADGISMSLARDDLDSYNKLVAQLMSLLTDLEKSFPEQHLWNKCIHKLGLTTTSGRASSLEEARRRFLPFSTCSVELAREMVASVPQLAHLTIYHCPMAPKPGLWLQTGRPLENPYFGAEMLSCGEVALNYPRQ